MLFSEYIEGSSNNKALEIANNTGSTVDLSIYTVKKQTNGAGTWSNGITLSGNLINGAKFVLVNSSIALGCYNASSANISTAGVELTFNGNDPVGLFKNVVLIDIIGTFNGGVANFAIDTTLRRKASVNSPNIIFNLATEWDSFAVDTCGGLGNKYVTDVTISNVKSGAIYPNPDSGNLLNIYNLENDSTYRIINMMGQELGKGKIENNSVDVSSIQSGTYLIEVSNPATTILKRFIKL